MPLMGSTSILILRLGWLCWPSEYALINPVPATVLLLVMMFLRLLIRAAVGLPVELFLIVFAGWRSRRCCGWTAPRIGWWAWVRSAKTAMVAHHVERVPMFTPHQYVAADPVVGERLSVTRLIVMAH